MSFCGGSDGDRCPAAPPYRNPVANAGITDTRAGAGFAADEAINTLALAQLAERAGQTAGIDPELGIASNLALRMLRIELAGRAGAGMVVPVLFEDQLAHEIAMEMQRLVRVQREAEERARQQLADLRAEADRHMAALVAEAERRDRLEEMLKTVPHQGVHMGELIGWRIWRVGGWALGAPTLSRGIYGSRPPVLFSFFQDTVWVPGEPMTGTPEPFTQEGVWAFKHRPAALNKAREASRGGCFIAFGAVELWGEVVEHELGWRAANAGIIALDNVIVTASKRGQPQRCWVSDRKTLNKLRCLYGVQSYRAFCANRAKSLSDQC